MNRKDCVLKTKKEVIRLKGCCNKGLNILLCHNGLGNNPLST